jgi:hypothetical protein
MELSKSTIIEGVASTEAKDSQGESLDLNGADISALLEGRGFVNSDHSNRFEHLVGRVLEAKKVHDVSDCETAQQVKYFSDKKKPFLWTKLELWDGHGHKEADAISSIYNYYTQKNEEAPIKLSVEGKTLERGKGGLLKRTVIKGVALTVHPANKTTKTDVVGIVKSAGAPESLVKSESYEVPLFIEEVDRGPVERIFDLAVTAKNLIQRAGSLQKSESSRRQLKCHKSLEQFRKMKSEQSD